MHNGFYEGKDLGNKNVPDGVEEIVGSLVILNGGIIETYYRKDGKLYVVSNIGNDKPVRTFDDVLERIKLVKRA